MKLFFKINKTHANVELLFTLLLRSRKEGLKGLAPGAPAQGTVSLALTTPCGLARASLDPVRGVWAGAARHRKGFW